MARIKEVEIMKKIKANKKVLVSNGTTSFERSVYIDDFGNEYFIYKGEKCKIYKTENGIFKAPWFNQVKYI